MSLLIDDTFYIKIRLNDNGCYDDFEWHDNLNNSKIIKLSKSQWTIRKREKSKKLTVKLNF